MNAEKLVNLQFKPECWQVSVVLFSISRVCITSALVRGLCVTWRILEEGALGQPLSLFQDFPWNTDIGVSWKQRPLRPTRTQNLKRKTPIFLQAVFGGRELLRDLQYQLEESERGHWRGPGEAILVIFCFLCQQHWLEKLNPGLPSKIIYACLVFNFFSLIIDETMQKGMKINFTKMVRS